MDNLQDMDFQLACPVHTLDFSGDYVVAGMYLLTMENEDIEKLLNRPDNLKECTLLFFEQRHLYEIGAMLYGVVYGTFSQQNVTNINEYEVARVVRNLLQFATKFPRYMDLKGDCINEVAYNRRYEPLPALLKEKLKYLMEVIWFIPYSNIDKLVRLAVDEFKNDKDKEVKPKYQLKFAGWRNKYMTLDELEKDCPPSMLGFYFIDYAKHIEKWLNEQPDIDAATLNIPNKEYGSAIYSAKRNDDLYSVDDSDESRVIDIYVSKGKVEYERSFTIDTII